MNQLKEIASWYLLLRRIALIIKIILILYLAFYLKANLSLIELGFYLILIPLLELVYKGLSNKKNHIKRKDLLLALMLSDIVILTQILSLTGGPTNPFSIFYLVYLVLTASLLDVKATISVALISCLGFISLFFWYTPLHALHAQSSYSNFSVHLQGMLYAFVLVSIIITYFLSKILKEKANTIKAIENVELQKRQFAKVTSITANAAHELGTPLSNISLIAEELNSSDLKIEIKKCKNIIEDLCIKSGSVSGESYSKVNIGILLSQILEELNIEKKNISIKFKTEKKEFLFPFNAVRMALKSLIQNAFEESKKDVSIVIRKNGNVLFFEIINNLMSNTIVNVTDFFNPFYTTKNSEKNLGLGVYIAKSVASELGGNLIYKIKEGKIKASFSLVVE